MTLTDAQLAEIEARANAARPSDLGLGIDERAIAEFWAHAVKDTPTLIAALRASREALRLAQVVVETLSEQPSYRSAATDGVLIEINAALGEEAS